MGGEQPQHNLLSTWGSYQTVLHNHHNTRQNSPPTGAPDLQVTGRGLLHGAGHEAEDRFPVDTDTAGVPRVMHRTGTLHSQAQGEEGRRTSSFHLFLAGEAEICMLTRSATSRTVARRAPLCPWDFPAKSWSQLPLAPPGR